MNLRTLVARSLRFHWRSHLGVVLGTAVATTVLVGALVVGDSVRYSLRSLALRRLGSVAVALTGRVWCWCDASYGPITPGDRLTTSDTPGHAMKVTDNQRAPGAVIGKAMTRLTEGKGLVLVLVNLQ